MPYPFVADSPIALGLTASVLALLYFFLMMINPNLPPALVFSAIIGYFVYSMKNNGINIDVQSITLPRINAQPALEERA